MSRRRVAVTGAAGQLGRQLVKTFTEAGDHVLGLARPDFDITRAADLERLIAWHPDVVINSAAWTDVDGCALDPDRAMRINGDAAGAVAAAAARAGALIVQISTNEVFDGTLDRPYREDDTPNPINPYGASKLRGEQLVAEANARHIIVRTAWLFGDSRASFVNKIIAAAGHAAATGVPLRVVADEYGNPTPAGWLASAVHQLLCTHQTPPILALVGQPAVSRLDWARMLLGPDREILAITLADFRRSSTVPPRATLDSQRADQLGIPAADWMAQLPQGENESDSGR